MKKLSKVLFVLFLNIITTSGFSQSNTYVEYEFLVEGSCGMCGERIQTIALSKPGVDYAIWDSESMLLKIKIDESQTSISHVKHAISLGGHDNGNFEAPPEVYENLPECCQYRKDHSLEEINIRQKESIHITSPVMMEYTFGVEGECSMCSERIENTATLHGAETAEFDLSTKMLTIILDETKVSVAKIRTAIANAGHDNGNFISPKKAYDNLATCCQYRSENNIDLDDNPEIDAKIKNHKNKHESQSQIEGYI